MRNLKKTLCVVLALVFVLGLCTVAAGAANGTEFDDQDTINYSTAVKAMSGLGILVGDDNDGDGKVEFRPGDNVTRAEAAKIIAYVNVGEEVEKWPARQVFDDVPADHWAAKYITYCQYNNIIAGYGNGKFGPSDPVTQAQLAKMLLSCCGYGAKDEFIGEGWDQNVAKVAFQTKVLKGILGTDWDGPANREETALLAYNTMMSVVQVVLSKDTSSYEPAFINGVAGQTLANSTWELTTCKGIITRNLANSNTAKCSTIELYTNGTWVGDRDIYTPDDESADILGHEVTISFREEGVAPNARLVAYYVDDSCKEVTGTEANTLDLADFTCTVNNGVVAFNGGSVAIDPVGVTKNTRYLASGTYILNEEKKVVGYKTESFDVFPVTVNALTGIATVNGGIEINAPEGAKTGDLLTVYYCGNVLTGKFCTKQEKVAITQRQLVDYSAYFMGSWFTYNDGAIVPTDADNVGAIDLSTVNAVNIFVGAGATVLTEAQADLIVGWSYTLFFDAEGGLIGYADGVETAEAASATYYMFVADFNADDSYGVAQDYAQVIKNDGTTQNLWVPAPTGLATGDIVTVRPQVVGGAATGKYILTLAGVSAPDSAGLTKGAVSTTAYPGTDPQFDFSNAKFILYGGGPAYLGALTAKVATTERPAAGSNISYTFRQIKSGTVVINKIETVWFDTAAAVDLNVANSYVYVVSGDTKETKLVNNVAIPFFDGYKDGVAMSDLRVAANTAPAIGFYKYSVGSTGNYSLTAIPDGDGSATGVRNVYLINNDTAEAFFLNNTLYVKDAVGTKQAIDISNVKFVRIAQATDYDVAVVHKQATLDSAAAIQSLLLTVGHNYKVTISFVEIVTPTGIPGVNTHSVGSGVIYVTIVE